MAKNKPFHEEFAEKIIEDLKAGTAPWIKPWQPGEYSPPFNPVSGTRYRGINRVMLGSEDHADPRYLTFRQAKEKGWSIKKGSKSRPVVYWQFTEEAAMRDDDGNVVKDDEGNTKKVHIPLDKPRIHFARVFHASQVEGIDPWDGRDITWDPNDRAETILKNSKAYIVHDQRDRAFYRSSGAGEIHLPPKTAFDSADKYYATALHELGHWTGHESRLDREGGPFGSELYAKEELRAEIASWMLGGEIGTGHEPDQHLAYVGSWIKALEQDPFEIVRACRDAEKILGYCLDMEKGLVREKDQSKAKGAQKMADEPERGVQQPAPEKTYLAVPYEQRNQAKKAGARWDRNARLWFLPKGADMAGVAQWVPEKQPAQAPAMPPEREFAEVLKDAGLDLKGELPIMDGQLHRVPLIDGKPGTRDGAYKGYLDGRPAGFYQNHKTGDKGNWKATGHRLTAEQKAVLKAEVEQKKLAQKQDLANQHEAASKKAFARWANAEGWAPSTQPYLAKKGVYGYGVKVNERDELLIPGRDVDGHIHTLQTVNDQGKFFIKGSRKTGTFHTIDPDRALEHEDTPLLVAEGYATAASVHMATGEPCHAAFDAGNLKPVAEALQAKYPDRPIIIVADNDHGQENNPGLAKAEQAARAVGGLVAAPQFTDKEKAEGRTDFNDLHASRGINAVRTQLAPALNLARNAGLKQEEDLAPAL